MVVDFAVAVPTEAAGQRIAQLARERGFSVSLTPDADEEEPDATSWSCNCSMPMILTYEAVVRVQAELHLLAKPFGGFPDGWGTFGNSLPTPHGSDADK
jgi:Regulator of ribonuclease activity B